MPDSAAIGAGFSDYQGNAGLGGGNFGPITVDTRPLERLAQYTVMYNKSVWDQNQKDTDAKVAKLADLSKIHVNDLRGKDRDQAIKEFADLQKYAAEYARKTPKNAQEKMQNELEWQSKYGAFQNNFTSGKARAVTYEKRYGDVMAGDAATRDAKLKILDREFEGTGIETQISAINNFETQKFDIPNPTAQTYSSVAVGPNQNEIVNGSIYNPKINAAAADIAWMDIGKAYPAKGSPEYNKLSQQEKDQADVQASVKSSGKGWVDATGPLNDVLRDPKYANEDGSFNAEKFESDNASNTTIMSAYNALKNLDAYSKGKYSEAKSGVFNDKGLSAKLPSNISPDDFKAGFIDFSKGVNANQLLQAGMYAKYQGDKFVKTMQQTDNANQAGQLAETVRHNKATEYLTGKQMDSVEEKWRSAQTGSQTQTNGAMEKAKSIYAAMLKLADADGVISPDKVRQLNVEQRKYLGIEVPARYDEAGTLLDKGGFKPLDVSDKKTAIQLVNGEIKVMSNASLRDDKKGWHGEWDNTRSTNINNIATNRLNEELKNSGSKELNTYLPLDVAGSGTISTTTTGGGSSQSGAIKTVDMSTLDPNGFKKEGNNYRYKDGTLFDANGNIIK